MFVRLLPSLPEVLKITFYFSRNKIAMQERNHLLMIFSGEGCIFSNRLKEDSLRISQYVIIAHHLLWHLSCVQIACSSLVRGKKLTATGWSR